MCLLYMQETQQRPPAGEAPIDDQARKITLAFLESIPEIRGLLAGWLMTSAGFDLAGETRPLIPMLIVSGLAADLLVRRRLPRWQLGFILGVISLLANLPLVEAANINWHPGALLTGVPLGLALSVAAAYLGAVVAGALEPNTVEGDRPVKVGQELRA